MSSALKRKLPPYGREVTEALQRPDTWADYVGTSADGRNVQLFVACGAESWAWVSERRAYRYLAVALPPDSDPEAFNWEFLADHDPVLLYAAGYVEETAVEAIVQALLTDGVMRVLFDPGDGSPLDLYVSEGVADVN